MISTDVYTFRKARPVWETGKELEKSCTLSFVTEVHKTEKEVTLALAASCSFVVTVNGRLIAHGPARCAHGYFRVDEVALSAHLTEAVNVVAVRVVGYNINSFSYLNQPSFLCAEVRVGDRTTAYTDAESVGFTAYAVPERIQRVQKYSFQRTFVESYDLHPGAFAYEYGSAAVAPVSLIRTDDACPMASRFLRRDIPYGDYDRLDPVGTVQTGCVSYSEKPAYYASREIVNIGDQQRGFRPDELTYSSHVEVGKMDFSVPEEKKGSAEELTLAADTYVDLTMARNFAGIFEFDLETEGGELFFLFDEILSGEHHEVNAFRMGTSAIVAWKAEKGCYHLVCAEPYTLKYLRVVAKGGAMTVRNLHMVKIAFPRSAMTVKLGTNEEQLKKIYEAAVETFAANAVDIYMDCPSRERAGWLCDSFFTSRVEKVLTGQSKLERAFLENFLLPDSFERIPHGMLPMCYPSDHYDGVYIPNWAMWYVMELGEYSRREPEDRALIEAARIRVYQLLDYFRNDENECGLLENLDSWIFVEWSKANELVRPVSYASNMLYAAMKATIADLYGDRELAVEAETLRGTIAKQSYTGEYFCDNATRNEKGELVPSGLCTEACQYYAFFCGIATPETYPTLWKTLVEDFGFERRKTKKHPEIFFANAFIGNYLRLDLLCRYGYKKELLENIRDYFTYMADRTGTLWEHENEGASCNHGFASHILYWLDKLGLLEKK